MLLVRQKARNQKEKKENRIVVFAFKVSREM